MTCAVLLGRGSFLGLAIVLASIPATAADRTSSIKTELSGLEAGQFVWRPRVEEAGPIEIVISLGSQRAYVFRGGELIGASTISSGRPGHESPVGRFQILQKRKVHRSNLYDNAPMPFMQRLNWYGVALHGGHVPDRPASHGCIRLPMKFAEALYGVTYLGGFVYVSNRPLPSPKKALRLARAHADAPMPPDRMRRGSP